MNAAETAVKECRNRLVTENLGLVHLCANRFRNRGIEYEELYSSGCVGLVKAANSFDEERGVKFSTYAVPVILGEIKRIFRDGGMVKVSRSLKELSLKVMREKTSFIAKKGREPSVSELAEIIGCEADDIVEALSAAQPCLSLTRYGESDESEEQDIPSSFKETDIYDSIALSQAMDRLDAADRQLICLRYFRSFTQSRAAEVLGLTQVHVSRREKKVLAELKKELFGYKAASVKYSPKPQKLFSQIYQPRSTTSSKSAPSSICFERSSENTIVIRVEPL